MSSSAPPNPAHILTKIGGAPALEATVNLFYEKLVADEALKMFFEGVSLPKLKVHQRKFLTIALTEIPDDLDVAKLIYDKHHRLFAMGLDETHFDKVAGHLVDTLKELDVSQPNIDAVVAVVAPLRQVFEDGKKVHLLDKIGGPPALEAAVEIFYEKLETDKALHDFFDDVDVDSLKKDLIEFLSEVLKQEHGNSDVAATIIAKKHHRMFVMGLDETHFDLVEGHVISTLEGLQVAQENIDAVVGIVKPLRQIFMDGKKQHLLDKIGGPPALEAAVTIFYERLVGDAFLKEFFVGIDVEKLKEHQKEFLTLAFTKVPDGVDVPKMMSTKHETLFEKGLNEKHFDSVAGHLVETLKGLQVKQEHIDAIVSIVAPLRKVFEEGAAKASSGEPATKKLKTSE